MNAFASASAEILGATVGSLLQKVVGLKIALIFSFSLSTLGAFNIWYFGNRFLAYTPLMCLGARTGVTSAFNIVYYSNSRIFPAHL